MNKRQAKKRKKFVEERNTYGNYMGFKLKGWSEIRWSKYISTGKLKF